MFQFTTQTIINDLILQDIEGNPLVDGSGNNVLRFYKDGTKIEILGVGTLQKKYIESVYHREAKERSLETATLTISNTGVSVGDVVRVTITPSLSGKQDAEYVNSSLTFKHPQVIDFKVADVSKIAEEAAAVLKGLRTEFGKSMFIATGSGNVLTVKAKDAYQRLRELKAEKVEELTSHLMVPKLISLGTAAVTVVGKVGFGDYAWMVRNVTLPTTQNRSFFGIKQDERPIEGAMYDQITIRYVSPTGQDDVWNGDKKSVVTHVLWIKSDIIGGALRVFDETDTDAGDGVEINLVEE